MGRKFRNLLPAIVSSENLREAYRRARKDKRMSVGHLRFKEHAEANLAQLAAEIAGGSYTVGEYHTFTITDPKPRVIMALPFRDRVAQHALCNVVEPIFDAVLLPMCVAGRCGKGTHHGVLRVQGMLRRLSADGGPVYCLKMDFAKYFASVDRPRLHREIRRKISCDATLRLIESITPATGCGLPIGNLTSQLWANLYGHILDGFLVHEAGVTTATRYMDDTVILARSLEELRHLKVHIDRVVEQGMGLAFSKWSIQPISRGVNFLGYRIWPTHRLLRRDSVKRARRRLRALSGPLNAVARERFLAAWRGHASWANSGNLMRSMSLGMGGRP